ncbi:hypothetical protein Droror1_Dr00017886 [Drosera rotundifolia]
MPRAGWGAAKRGGSHRAATISGMKKMSGSRISLRLCYSRVLLCVLVAAFAFLLLLRSLISHSGCVPELAVLIWRGRIPSWAGPLEGEDEELVGWALEEIGPRRS